jgi:hypothetical protein
VEADVSRVVVCVKVVSKLVFVCIFQIEGERGRKKHSDTFQVVSDPYLVCIFQAKRRKGENKHSDTHQVVSEREIFLYIADRGSWKKMELLRTLRTCLQVGNSP